MKFTLSWLKEHLETDADVDTIARTLTMLGLEVEEVVDRARGLEAFRVAFVVSAEKHPNADKLRVCRVDTGAEIVQVVCGAPNARTGMKGVFAPVGTHIPGTGVDLKKGVIRGVESNGMLVSEREMGLSDEHTGIIDLPEDAPVGEPFASILGLDDPVIDVALTPDRADCAGVKGIARDLAAAGLGTLKPQPATPVQGLFASRIDVSIPDSVRHACPMFVGRMIRGVRNGPSPRWLQDRLTAIGLRPITTLVDITNYITMDIARPLHVFDADKVQGPISPELGRGGASLSALNGKTYTLDDDMTAICDGSGVLGLGGIIGGESTGCTEATINVFIECALFDPIRTAATGRKLGIDSDARYRFERGVDPAAVISGMERATRMVLDLCGGEPSDLVIAGETPDWARSISFRPDRTRSLGGVEVAHEDQVRILSALGFEIEEGESGTCTVQVPSWRRDVEGEADLVEEVVRVNGYDRIPATPMVRETTITVPAVTASQRRTGLVKRTLAARGLHEAVTWSFMATALAERFAGASDGLKLVNPISADLETMRPSVLPNLIQAAGRNADRGYPDVALFEVGPIYRDPTPKGQDLLATGVRAGSIVARHWTETARLVDAYDAKADALAVLEAAGAPVGNLQATSDAPNWYHPGRSAVFRLGATVLARFGELHPTLLNRLGARSPMVGFEVFLDAVPEPRKKTGTAKPMVQLSPFQPVGRDFAFVVDEGVDADRLVRAVRAAEKALVKDVAIFDVYQGRGIDPGKKSVALAVTLQPIEKTLTDAELEDIAKRIVASVEKATGGVLRG